MCALLLDSAQMARPVSSNQQIGISLFFRGMERLLIANDVLRTGKVTKIIFRHGFGNWNEIADYIDTNKTREDVERHYSEIFLSSPGFLPVITPNI